MIELIRLYLHAFQVRPENYQDDECRRMEDLSVSLQVMFSRRRRFAWALFFCELLIPICNIVAWIEIIAVLGREFVLYGYHTLWDPFVYSPYIRVQDLVFPVKLNCRLEYIGPSGSQVTPYTICFFPASALYQLAFIGIWYVTYLL